MMYEKNGEWIVEVSEDEVEQSIDYLTDMKNAMEKSEKARHMKDAVKHISTAIETMIAFCMEHFELEEE